MNPSDCRLVKEIVVGLDKTALKIYKTEYMLKGKLVGLIGRVLIWNDVSNDVTSILQTLCTHFKIYIL
jgi:uncharacterized metal-binding protein